MSELLVEVRLYFVQLDDRQISILWWVAFGGVCFIASVRVPDVLIDLGADSWFKRATIKSIVNILIQASLLSVVIFDKVRFPGKATIE